MFKKNFRYDYENCEAEPSNKMMKDLETKITASGFVGQKFENGDKTFVVETADNFQYVDPIDKSVSKNQVCFANLQNYIFRNLKSGLPPSSIHMYHEGQWYTNNMALNSDT